MSVPDDFVALIDNHWPSGDAEWFNQMAGSGWTSVDWPISSGGTGWARQEQLSFVTALATHGCPLMPDSIVVLAPLLLAHGSPEQQEYFLPRIAERPQSYCFSVDPNKPPGCHLDTQSGNLILADDEGRLTPLHTEGNAELLLSTSYSPLWLLHEQLLGLSHLRNMARYWDEETSIELAEAEIEVASLTSLFLQCTKKADKQIALRVNSKRQHLYHSLFQSLGYYALLSPDAIRSSNEPLPFPAERNFLQSLRKQIDRDTLLLKNQLYLEHLAVEEDQ